MPKHETLTSSSDSDSENERRLKAKLRKEDSRKRKAESSSAKAPAPKKPAAAAAQSTSGGEEKISLGKMKFVTVRPFKNMIFVDIREHYEKDGEMKPGKKGISLQAAQWQKLKENIDLIDEKIQELC